VKYYIYISDAKVNMLFPQVPHDIKKKVATEWKMDLKVLSAARKVETESEDNRIARLETVVDFIREYGNIGNVDKPDQYIEDTLSMRWGQFGGGPDSSVVYFGGETSDAIIGLGGSMSHVIGNVGSAAVEYGSLTPYLMKVLSPELKSSSGSAEPELEGLYADYYPLRAVKIATYNMEGPKQKLEFLAKRLLYWGGGVPPNETPFPDDKKQGHRVILGTPLYVAMAD
jgi:hypothetical protein